MNYIPTHCKFNLHCVCPEAVWGKCPQDWTPGLQSLPTIAGSSGASWLQWNSHEQSPPIWMDQVGRYKFSSTNVGRDLLLENITL